MGYSIQQANTFVLIVMVKHMVVSIVILQEIANNVQETNIC